ncbi:hypothetical protein CA54_23450 [Symmachiella macrocystis]|uniref:Phytase-like domain-containing protein n=1 Tax=Symmachiella macrocystis TaxID=2527985 RepID=A0A5C6BMY0_9PLAN|nr:DUF6454 family protein [Symmachiella macrocystis]TWU13510.1 hypothetical protein CA54_23450 [Symmachiella macrocystis]
MKRWLGIVVIAMAMQNGWSVSLATAQSLTLEYEAVEALPNFDIDGKPARIHTQGLFVTQRHYYVTGRLETPPRRALLLRFDRKDLKTVEFVDITPKQKNPADALRLDHPGGFDFDGREFWIPISASRPQSRTVVLRFPHQPDKRLSATVSKVAFTSDDHIGAIACDSLSRELYGANWDTKLVYRWRMDGRVVETIPRQELVSDDKTWAMAVQDWKGLDNHQILAGGIDKNRDRDPAISPAVVAILDIPKRTMIASARLPRPEGTELTLTREGLAIRGDQLFFLPGDLGQHARVFRYQWKIMAE